MLVQLAKLFLPFMDDAGAGCAGRGSGGDAGEACVMWGRGVHWCRRGNESFYMYERIVDLYLSWMPLRAGMSLLTLLRNEMKLTPTRQSTLGFSLNPKPKLA